MSSIATRWPPAIGASNAALTGFKVSAAVLIITDADAAPTNAGITSTGGSNNGYKDARTRDPRRI